MIAASFLLAAILGASATSSPPVQVEAQFFDPSVSPGRLWVRFFLQNRTPEEVMVRVPLICRYQFQLTRMQALTGDFRAGGVATGDAVALDSEFECGGPASMVTAGVLVLPPEGQVEWAEPLPGEQQAATGETIRYSFLRIHLSGSRFVGVSMPVDSPVLVEP